MKPIVAILLPIIFCLNTRAQSYADSLRQANIERYYQQAVRYKDGLGTKQDFKKAYQGFLQAAELGDPQSIYSKGYMLYKGLGCTQDYAQAAILFEHGARKGRDNSMYFYGLCFRNGYGVAKNGDSAVYWLKRADLLGYQQAALELKMTGPENSNDSAKALVSQMVNAAMPDKVPPNHFTKINHNLPDGGKMAGQYVGWVVQYDWSGRDVVGAKRLMLTILEDGGAFSGMWVEGTDTAMVKARINASTIDFSGTSYKRKDHYSPTSPVAYDFQVASLNMVQQDDSLFLAGSMTMFSPDRREPSKPLFVILSRIVPKIKNTTLTVGPNPFNTMLNVNIELIEAVAVEVDLISETGTVVYRNLAGMQQPGSYRLILQPGILASGAYFLKIRYGNGSKLVKVIKQ